MADAEFSFHCEQENGVPNPTIEGTEGLEEISLGTENSSDTDDSFGENVEETVDGVPGGCTFDSTTAVNGLDDLGEINFMTITAEAIVRYHFPDLDVAYMFYNWYASSQGFSARKSHVMRNKNGDVTQKTFLCHKEGQREENCNKRTDRKRLAKPVTRCGCEARCIVRIDTNSRRWYIKFFNDFHNHTMLVEPLSAMLPAHRQMSDYDKFQMASMKKVGISTKQIYGFFASEAGGFDKVGYGKRDMYNEQVKERRVNFSDAKDAKAALDYLKAMKVKDDLMFWKHTIDKEGQLEHLFWCDGVSQKDFSIFGDVLAFDATYKKIKYMCPIVVFSGVNHHNQSIVFASAIVANETEDTYVWLLQNFLEAMSGKCPVSVITDGDSAMRNAIKKVFPTAHHRLCAWHLLRNAKSNVKNPQFLYKFRQCMLGDYEIGEFRRKWEKLVADFGLEQNNWVTDLYDKRRMWAAAYMRGNFFAGFRTTSRCEGLHSEFGKYVNYRNNLLDLVQHFFRWLNYMRYREVEADFVTARGEPVLQTRMKSFEKSAADVFTREIFLLFRPVLERALACRVIGVRQTANSFIYTVSVYRREGMVWRVSFCTSSLEFKCSCLRLESLGIPCEHLVTVMVYLDMVRLPDCVVLKRWTKSAKDCLEVRHDNQSSSSNPVLIGQYKGLVERCMRMSKAALDCGKQEHMRKTIEIVATQTEVLEALCRGEDSTPRNVDPLTEGSLRNPARVRTKGCGNATSSTQDKGKQKVQKPRTCGVCGEEGHNRKSCRIQREIELMSQTHPSATTIGEDDEYHSDEFENMNVDMDITSHY